MTREANIMIEVKPNKLPRHVRLEEVRYDNRVVMMIVDNIDGAMIEESFNEIEMWCKDNMRGPSQYTVKVAEHLSMATFSRIVMFYFKHVEDAIFFKLRWVG